MAEDDPLAVQLSRLISEAIGRDPRVLQHRLTAEVILRPVDQSDSGQSDRDQANKGDQAMTDNTASKIHDFGTLNIEEKRGYRVRLKGESEPYSEHGVTHTSASGQATAAPQERRVPAAEAAAVPQERPSDRTLVAVLGALLAVAVLAAILFATGIVSVRNTNTSQRQSEVQTPATPVKNSKLLRLLRSKLLLLLQGNLLLRWSRRKSCRRRNHSVRLLWAIDAR